MRKLVLRVLACITTEHDYRLVLLAALICAATSFTAFHAYSYATLEQGSRRMAWVFLTAVCTGAGIWATHFVAMLAYDPGHPTDYDPVLTIASLLIAAVVAMAGFGISVRGSRAMVAAGGAVIGAGIGLMHFTGMHALIIPGTLGWDKGLVVASILIGIALASAALLAHYELERRKALWIAPALLTLAICGLHFTAMAAVTVVPDPRIVVHPSAMNSSTLAIAVTAITVLVMLALLAITLITSEGKRDALVRNQELVDAALEGLVVAKDGVIVNVNRRFLKLTLNTPAELLGKRIVGDLVIVAEGKVYPSGKATEGLLKTATGLAVQVEVVCRPLSGSARANEVYAVRDLTDRRRIEEELRRQNRMLQEQDEELRIRNRRFEATLANLPHGLCMIDRERRVLVCNKRYVDMYDLPAQLVEPGTSIEDIFEYLVGKGLYAPAEGEEYRSKGTSALFEPAAKTRRLSDGRVIQVSRQPTAEGGWIVIHEDITESQNLNAQLEAQNANLDMALANMSQGLAMFDAQERLVLANDRYAEIYGLEPQHLRPGTTLRELVEYRISKGLYTGLTADDVLQNMRARVARKHANHLVSRPGDGRVLSVAIQPRADGGWVVTLHDITEREQLNARLVAQNTLLQQREEELGAQNTRFDAAIGNMSQGMCLYDAQQRIVFANSRYGEIYGLTPEQVMPGTTLRQVFEARVANGDHPDADGEKFVRERLARFHSCTSEVIKLDDGRFISVVRRPMPDGGLLSTHEDITEREKLNARLLEQNALLQQREEELAAQNTRFDAAISNMSQGMCLYDAEKRVVFANSRYAAIYGLTPEQVKPGTTPQEILEARVANGTYSETEARDFVSKGVARFQSVSSEIIKLSDGRFISVVRRSMPGGGLLSTHEDITERERLNAQLARQNELLKQREQQLNARNEQLDAAMGNMLQGLAMYDAEQRLIMCNKRYAEMYGLSAEQVAPGTTLRQIFDYRLANGQYHIKDTEGFVESWAGDFGDVSSRIQELADGRMINVSRRRLTSGGRVVTHEDITERQKLNARLEQQNLRLKEQEEKLRNQNVQFDAALNNMLQGLAMYDSQQRLVVCNKRYAEMYGLTPEQVKPGTTLREIVAHRIARGEFRGKSADDLVRERIERVAGQRVAQYINELSDGRHIAVSTQPMPDGGTVTTHHDITEQRQSEAKIAHMALHDTLTGLPNRVLLNERLEEALRRVKRGEIVATHLIDLDHFKTVNDTLGHPAGDKLLKMVAERLRGAVRETDTIARMGGDEFAIVQTAITQPADATALAHRVNESVSAPYVVEGQQVVIGTSIGIAVGPSDGTSPDQLIRNADLALYRAKGDGRGTYRFFERDMDAQMQVRRALEGDLRNALAAGSTTSPSSISRPMM